jgi:hypothetical protein
MITLKHSADLKFTSPAAYRIYVKGFLDESWSDRFSGLQIENQTSSTGSPTTILQGTLLDQAQLLGVLSNLYEMHMSLISLELLDNE